jgi:phosphoglycerate dehydrogenase-like enzyme
MSVLYDPDPRETEQIFAPEARARFRTGWQVTEWQGEDRDAFYARHLPETDILISQQPMGRDRLDMAPNLRAIFNVETNFLPNIDYE